MHVAGLNIFTPPSDAGPHFVHDLLSEWRKRVHAIAPFNLRPVLRMGLWYWEGRRISNWTTTCHVPAPTRAHPRTVGHGVTPARAPAGPQPPAVESMSSKACPADALPSTARCHALIDGVTSARMAANAMSTDYAVAQGANVGMPFNTLPGAERRLLRKTLQQLMLWLAWAKEIFTGRRRRPVGHRARQLSSRARCPALSGTANALQWNFRFAPVSPPVITLALAHQAHWQRAAGDHRQRCHAGHLRRGTMRIPASRRPPAETAESLTESRISLRGENRCRGQLQVAVLLLGQPGDPRTARDPLKRLGGARRGIHRNDRWIFPDHVRQCG